MFKQFQAKFNALTCKSIENFIGITYSRNRCMATAFFMLFCSASPAQNIPAKTGNDANMPLHLLQPDYPVAYGKTTIEDITKVLSRVYDYLDSTTPPKLVVCCTL